ncbi:hypothetical protein ACIOJD_06180 [Streptomyces sp. NPDC088116]|uniref:hypothetical protein n=1 Tax=Streptomyces sp. NPDC088116 TaxID=3365825 RepID=UPI00380A212B
MHSDPALERRSARPGGHRRKRAAGPQEGPVFVDASGRRARLLRRAGIALGIACAGYVAVLGLAFMGGISLAPSEILPFDGGPAAAQGGGGSPPGGEGPPDGAYAPPDAPPSGQPATQPSEAAARPSDAAGAN